MKDNNDSLIMNVSKFVRTYYNINSKGLNKLSHSDLKEIFCLKSVASKNINEDKVNRGIIVLVKDCHDHVLGYLNPFLKMKRKDIKESFDKDNSKKITFTEEEKVHIDKEDLHDYSNYELEALLKQSKKTNDDRSKNMIIKEFKTRTKEEDNNKKATPVKVKKK